MFSVVYDPLPSQEQPLFQKGILYDTFFYSVRAFARVRQHYFSKYLVHGPSPHLKFFGGAVPPVSP